MPISLKYGFRHVSLAVTPGTFRESLVDVGVSFQQNLFRQGFQELRGYRPAFRYASTGPVSDAVPIHQR